MSDDFTPDDHRHMARALELAERGLYTTHPNPRVGCVLVRDGRVVGEGWHRRAGGPHAEVEALSVAGADARGATVYLTLEPCAHHGRTPPCADALIAAGVARVIAAMEDPNPLVSGKGCARLRAAGIAVVTGLMGTAARALNPGFITRMTRRRPWVRLKVAASLDGAVALASGESRWITGSAARADVQRWRARSGAVVTGIGTVLADDPRLDVRVESGVFPEHAIDCGIPQPLRVVVDSRLRFSAQARMLDVPGEVWVATAVRAPFPEALIARGVQLVSLPEARGRVDLAALTGRLAQAGVNEMLVEAGPGLAGAFLDAGLVDELVWYVAPHLLGASARGALAIETRTAMRERIDLEWLDAVRVGEDLRVTMRPRSRSGAGAPQTAPCENRAPS